MHKCTTNDNKFHVGFKKERERAAGKGSWIEKERTGCSLMWILKLWIGFACITTETLVYHVSTSSFWHDLPLLFLLFIYCELVYLCELCNLYCHNAISDYCLQEWLIMITSNLDATMAFQIVLFLLLPYL